MILAARIKGRGSGTPSQPTRPIQQHLGCMVVSDVVVADAHEPLDPIQALLEIAMGEERETLVCPVPANKLLGFQTDAPVDRATATPAAAGKDIRAAVLAAQHSMALEKMSAAVFLVHGQSRRRKMVALVHHKDLVPSLCEDFGAHRTAAAGSYNHDIRVDSCGFLKGLELQEVKVKAGP